MKYLLFFSALATSVVAFATDPDLYRYSRHLNNCINSTGEVGRNNDGSFECADFKDEDWAKRDLQNVSFKGSNLIGVNFYMANLAGANFTGANLTGSSFFKANLTGAIFSNETKLPDNTTKADIQKWGGTYLDYDKLDQEFTEAIISGDLANAENLRLKGAEINSGFSDNSERILAGPTKQILQFLLKISMDFSYKDKDGYQRFFDRFFPHLAKKQNLTNVLDSREELTLMLQRGYKNGLKAEIIWEETVSAIDIYSDSPETVNFILDFALTVPGLDINRPKNGILSSEGCESLISTIGFKPYIFDALIKRGFSVQNNSCFRRDTKNIVRYMNGYNFESQFILMQKMETQGWDFKKIVDGKSVTLDTLIYQYFNERYDKDKLSVHDKLVQYWGLNQAAYLSMAPVSMDSLFNRVIEDLSRIQHNRELSLHVIQLFQLHHLKNSQGKNLVQAVTFSHVYQEKYYLNEYSTEAIEAFVDLGIPLSSEGHSAFLALLEAFHKFGSEDYTRKRMLDQMLELYKKTQTPLERTYKGQSVLFFKQANWGSGYWDVVQALIEYGFDPKVKDAEGKSLYWYYNYNYPVSPVKYLIDKGVPLSLWEEIGGNTLFETLAAGFGANDPHDYLTADARQFLQFLVENKVIDFADSITQDKLRSYAASHNNQVGKVIVKNLIERKVIPVIRFAECRLADGTEILLEDPKMDLLKSLNGLEDQYGWVSKDLSLIAISNRHDQIVDSQTVVAPLKTGFGFQMAVNSNSYKGKFDITSKDLKTIRLNDQPCVSRANYPADLRSKFRFLYMSDGGSQTIFLNLMDKKEGYGLEVSLGTIELRDFSDFNPQMWPREMPLPDHYLWQMYTPNDNVGALALPKSLVDHPQVGKKFILHYFLRGMKPIKVESLEFIPTGISY